MTAETSNLKPYELLARFDGDHVIHTTSEPDPAGSERKIEIKTRWTWKQTIGHGRFGIVYLEEDEGGKRRAVKKLAQTSGLKKVDYLRELSLSAKVADRQDLFVQFLGWYQDRTSIFIAMEYMEHGDLSRYIGRSDIKQNVKDISRQLLRGLEVLHERNICHRDLKPQNILVVSIEPIRVKIADFGISKDEENTLLRTSCGTPGYLAPEVIEYLRTDMPKDFLKKGPGLVYTNSVDIWSLGCVLHEILTSETPFLRASNNLIENESGVVHGLPPPRETDIKLLREFCRGKKHFPTDVLRKHGVDNRAIEFLKRLLVANPSSRISATSALKSPWLLESSGPSLQMQDLEDPLLSGNPEPDLQTADERAGGKKAFSLADVLGGLFVGKLGGGRKKFMSPTSLSHAKERPANVPTEEPMPFPTYDDLWNPELRETIKYTSVQIHNGRQLIDWIPCSGHGVTIHTIQDVRELVRVLQLVDPMAFGIPVCAGIINSGNSGGILARIGIVFNIPENLVNPRSLRDFLLSSNHEKYSISERIRLAKSVARTLSFLHSSKFVHNDFCPETIIIFHSSQQSKNIGIPFLVGFRKLCQAHGNVVLMGDTAWERNIYQHPDHQGKFPKEVHRMRHDIYSLGVCLLEIALWKSFVLYDDNGSPSGLSEHFCNRTGFVAKDLLVKMAREMIPQRLGDRYTNVTISCLECLDDDSGDSDSDDSDDNGTSIILGQKRMRDVDTGYIEKILDKLEEIMA